MSNTKKSEIQNENKFNYNDLIFKDLPPNLSTIPLSQNITPNIKNNNNNIYELNSFYNMSEYLDYLSGIPYLNGINYPQYKIPFIQKIPLKILNNNEYVYVNNKQYIRILKRREMRKKLNYKYNMINNEKKYIHESRHKHAMNRERGKGGRFLSKKEKEIIMNKSDTKKCETNSEVSTSGEGNNNNNNHTIINEFISVKKEPI
jgi:hypothetical protein